MSRGGTTSRLTDFGISQQHEHRFVNAKHLQRISHAFDREPVVLACARVLEAGVLAGGVALVRGGAPVTLTDTFRAWLDEHWVCFARDCIAAVLKFGFVVCQVAELKEGAFGEKLKGSLENRLTPVCLDASCERIQIVREGAHTKYTLVDAQGEPVKNAHIFVRSPPTCDGEATSAMATLLESIEFIQRLGACALQAENVRSRYLITCARPPPPRPNPTSAAARAPEQPPAACVCAQHVRGQARQGARDPSQHQHVL